jgi:hypothetical protein
MKKVDFDINKTLGETAASKAFGIECLNCFESGLWQMMRQYGIKDYTCILGTTAFFVQDMNLTALYYIKSLFKNMAVLENNMNQYYQVSKESYQPHVLYDSPDQFIKSTIDQNQFVYILYNNYYDSLNMSFKRKMRNTYHNNILTGYDDENKRYISLMEGKFDIRFQDYTDIYQHFQRRPPLIWPWVLFRLQGRRNTVLQKDDILPAIRQDWKKTLNDWEKEMEFFERESKAMEQLFCHVEALDEKRLHYLFLRRGFFVNSNNGFHGNLYMKLKLLEESTRVDVSIFAKKYLNNRKQSEIIANLFGKAYVNYNYEHILHIAENIRSTYVLEAKILYQELLDLLYQSKILNGKEYISWKKDYILQSQ